MPTPVDLCRHRARCSTVTPSTILCLVDQAINRYKTEGREATLAYYNSPESVDGQWYVFIHDENNVTIAHPRSELLGRTRDQRIDANGHDYGAEFASATEEGKWVNYVFYNPETEEESLKHTWVVRHDGLLFGSGWYDEQP